MPGDIYAFDITLHGLPSAQGEPPAAGGYEDLGRSWPTLHVPRDWLSVSMDVGFDEALERLGRLERMVVEPDGSLLWTMPCAERRWQVDGNAYERDGRVLFVDMKGRCPSPEFDRLLACFGWPAQRLLVQLVRPAVFFEESTFRSHAVARGLVWDGGPLRPS